MAHRKIFNVTETLEVKVVLTAAKDLANLKSFKNVGIHYLVRTISPYRCVFKKD